MTSPTLRPEITVVVNADDHRPIGGALTLDALAVPYGSGTVELPLNDDTALEDLDPRDDVRVTISGSASGHWEIPPPQYTAWTETRRNLAPSPAATSLSRFACTLGVLSLISGGGVLFTRNTGGSARALEIKVGTTLGTVASTVTIRFEIMTPSTSSCNLRPGTASSTGSIALDVSTIPANPGVWQTFEGSAEIPAGWAPTATAGFVIINNSTTIGAEIRVRNIQVEKVSKPLGTWFDGDTADTDVSRYSWTATVNDSPSILETRTRLPDLPPVWVADPSRTFDLGIRSRSVDVNARTVSLECATDEALLQDYAVLAADAGSRAHQASLRAVVNYVLGHIGAALEPGTPDADVTAQWSVTNLLTNPSLEFAVTGWAAVQSVTVARFTSAAAPGAGTSSLQATVTGAGDAVVRCVPVGSGPAVTPGTSYVFSMFSPMNPVVAPKFFVRIHWMNNAGTIVGIASGPQVNAVNGVWTRASVIATAPAGASRADLFFIAPGVTTPGHTFLLDAAMFHEGEELIPYFDGGTAADARYVYSWGNSPHESTSARTTTAERPPELFVWKPGVTAWDFLEPLLSPESLRLFCDENRDWRLIDPASYTVPGSLRLNGNNVVSGSDTISRDDADVFATGVVIRYVWEDGNGIARTAYDSAGTPNKVVTIDYARAYPGPGAAAAILARRSGTGRTQDVDALIDWAATPGNDASISLPTAPEQQGKVSSVRFSLGDDAVMSVGTRGLIDIPADSWLAWDPAQAWQDVADSVTWISLP